MPPVTDALYTCSGDSDIIDPYEAAYNWVRAEEPAEHSSLRKAIERNDTSMVRNMSESFRGKPNLGLKHDAIIASRPECLKILLEEDSATDVYLMTVACERKDRDSISLLLDHGWPINRPLHLGAVPLCYAVNDLAFMHWLIAKGAEVNARSVEDESALSAAISRGSMDVVDFLLAQEDDVTRGNLLHCAARRKSQSEGAVIAQTVLDRGADVNAHRYNNDIALRRRLLSCLPTPLHVACDERNLPVADVLTSHGGNPHCKMLAEFREVPPTPMETAYKLKDKRMIDLLTIACLAAESGIYFGGRAAL